MVYIILSFLNIEALTGAQTWPKGTEEKQTLQTALESSKKAVIQGSMDCLLVSYIA